MSTKWHIAFVKYRIVKTKCWLYNRKLIEITVAAYFWRTKPSSVFVSVGMCPQPRLESDLPKGCANINKVHMSLGVGQKILFGICVDITSTQSKPNTLCCNIKNIFSIIMSKVSFERVASLRNQKMHEPEGTTSRE